ncbi:MAG: hypothetical protein P4L51_14305, partial [Puia sp.]|nr:hypothetical protein [Puia sp.]
PVTTNDFDPSIPSDPRTLARTRELAAMAALPEDRIDTRETLEQRDWTGARRGVFHRPAKKS